MNIQTHHLPFDVSLLPARMLSAGNLKCMYENGNLRYITFDNKEVIRMIYSAVRDQHWETATYEIRDEVIEENEAGFAITYNAFYQLNQIHYKAAFQINADTNSISFAMKGVALNSFKTNRIGICVLHPIDECAGKKVVIKRADNSGYEATFPERVSPHQPFKEVQQMRWSVENGVKAQITFEGDVFETEDQRNWTDASFKTYSRSVELPFPYSVNEGETIEQKVTLKISGDKRPTNPSDNSISFEEIKVPFPKIGYSRPKGSKRLTITQIELLQKVPFDHYRVELRLYQTDWQEELSNALYEAKELYTKLELIVFFDERAENELKGLVEKLQDHHQNIASILVLQSGHNVTQNQLLQQVYQVLKAAMPRVEIGFGTDGFFADLNQNRPQVPDYDFVSFSINPQVHAVDMRSIIENLSAQADTIATAQSFIGDKAIHISPITLKMRSNGEPVNDIDRRLHTSFAAYWTLQTIANLSAANRITFYETTGAKGIIKESESSSAELYQSEESLLTPVYKVLAAMAAFQPEFIIKQNGIDPSNETFVIENKTGDRLMFVGENVLNVKDANHL